MSNFIMKMTTSAGGKDTKKLMKEYGFKIFRQKKHLVWRDDFGNQIITPVSPSDNYRMIENLKNRLNKIRNENKSK